MHELVQVDFQSGSHRTGGLGVVDLDLERVLRARGRGAHQHGETGAHRRGSVGETNASVATLTPGGLSWPRSDT